MPARERIQMKATSSHGPGRQTVRRDLFKQADVYRAQSHIVQVRRLVPPAAKTGTNKQALQA